jgi:hypothetical protein
MDDNYRLLKLISLVGWAHPAENQCGLRYRSDSDESRLTKDEQVAGHLMCAYYSGAVEHHRGDTDVSKTLDRRQLPDMTLAFVARGLSADAVDLLGDMVQLSLGLGDGVDRSLLGQMWVQDVTQTCWRLALANDEERFGRME